MRFFILDFRSNDVGGAVMPGHLTSASSTIDALCACDTIVFLVHGFNVSRPEGAAQLQNLSWLLPAIGDGAAVAVLWPGDSMLGPLSYPFESNNADDTSVELAKFIGDNLAGGPSISFAAHSLGSRVVMQTVQQLKIKDVEVKQVCLMAGAIDNDSLANIGEYQAAARYAQRVAVLFSPSDTVLKLAYPAGNLLSAFFHWTATSNAALGFTGPKSCAGIDGSIPAGVEATGIPTANAVSHSDYLPNAAWPPTPKQLAAARYTNAVLMADSPLRY
jgi:hypothetical protein